MFSLQQAHGLRTALSRLTAFVASGGLLAATSLLAPPVTVAAKSNAHASVVGGQTTAIQAAPFQVALYDPQITPGAGEPANPVQSQFCGGVILDAWHVITAGHCIMNQEPRGVAPPSHIEILAGTNDINTADGQPGGYVEDPVSQTSFNPLWEPVSSEHDIGLLTLSNPLWTGPAPSIDGTTRIAPIPPASSLPPVSDTLTVSGWGYDRELVGEARPSEEAGFQRHLQSAQIPLVAQSECIQDYRTIGWTVPTGTVCAGSGGHGPCYSDSGGPLFTGPSTPPGDYALLGIVDTGYGCAQASFPGIFQSLLDLDNLQFISSNPPQAPLELAGPTLAGTPLPGHTLTCSPGSWSGSPTYTYAFYRDEAAPSTPGAHTELTSLSSRATYTVAATDAGQRIFCLARATNAGGYDFDVSQDLAVAGTAPAQRALLTRPPAPTLTVVSKSCLHMRCIVDVHASEGTGQAAVTTVKAALSFKRWGACRRRYTRRLKCLHTSTAKTRVTAIPASHFVILTGRLNAGRYKLSLLAIDRAGVRQIRPTDVRLTVTPSQRRR